MKKLTILFLMSLLFVSFCNSCQMNRQNGKDNTSDTLVKSNVAEEWTLKNVPLDIMNRIKIGMNVGFLKEKLGEPVEVGQLDKQDYYTWKCEKIDITVYAINGTIKSMTFSTIDGCPTKGCYYLFTGVDTIYLAKSTFKTSQNDMDFIIAAGVQIGVDYVQTAYGAAYNDFTNYLYSGSSGFTQSDFDGFELAISLDKLPATFQEKIINDAAKSAITQIKVTDQL